MRLSSLLATLAACAGFIAAPAACAATTEGDRVAEVQAGGRTLVVPVLDGFAAPQETPPAVLEQLQKRVGMDTHLVAVMLSSAYLEHVAADQSTLHDRYYVVQVAKGTETRPLTARTFAVVRTILGHPTSEPRAGLGTFDDEPDAIAYATANAETFIRVTGSEPGLQIKCVGAIDLGGLLVFTGTSLPENDLAWAKATTTMLVARLRSLNPAGQ
jgi:hypothetical protein